MKIEFIPVSKDFELAAPMPKPAKMYIPDWYKKVAPTKNIEFYNGDIANDFGAIKRCMPFFDGLTMGYIQESWTDIHFKEENGGIVYNYAVKPLPVTIRNHMSSEISDKYYPVELTWKIPWVPKLPKGYSAMFTHPLNRSDLPFTTTTGLVDADVFFHTTEGSGNYPFYLQKGFEGVIPAGTPLYQIIPIKRENWKSISSPFNMDDSIRKNTAIRKHFINNYKRNFWHKKSYE